MTSVPCETIPASVRAAAAPVVVQRVTQAPTILLTGGPRGEILPRRGGRWYAVRADDATTHAA